MSAYPGCCISLDGYKTYGNGYTTREENLREAWNEIKRHGIPMPKSKDEFLRRGGRVEWYRSY